MIKMLQLKRSIKLYQMTQTNICFLTSPFPVFGVVRIRFLQQHHTSLLWLVKAAWQKVSLLDTSSYFVLLMSLLNIRTSAKEVVSARLFVCLSVCVSAR